LLHSYLGLVAAGLIAAQAPLQSPPIFNPGAPGAAPRVLSPTEAVALSRSGFTAADVAFMQHMIVHHAQAVEMVALLRQHGQDATVGKLGERIALTQEAEMEQMREWLTARALPLAAADPHAGHHGHQMSMDPNTPIMPGMLSPAQMTTLTAARGAAFDRLFLAGMIQHHQGALDMVDTLMAEPDSGEDPALSDFTTSVVADQSAEIRRMQSVLSDLQDPS